MSTDDFSNPAPGGSEFDPELLKAGQTLAGVFKLIKVLPSAVGESPIWIAHDQVAEREVSLHFVPPAVGTDPDLCEALRSEVRRCRQLIHPNILRVHDLADEPAWSAVVMDAYEGQSLARLLQEKERGFFEASEVFPWVESILKTLGEAHGIGLLHRNLSLNNIIVRPDGQVTLTAFGTSRAIVDALRRSGQVEESQLVYSSPRQLDGNLPSISDDIYSFGACLFELLTGRSLFEGRGIEYRIRNERPLSVMECRQARGRSGELLFPNWEKAIAQCLAKTPGERPESVAALEERLGLGQIRFGAKPTAATAAAARPVAKPAPVEPEPELEPVGIEGAELEEDVSEKASFGAPRPLFMSPESSEERGRQSRNALIFWLVAAAGIGAGIWFGSDALLKTLSPKPPQAAPEPAPVQELEKSKDGAFVPPAAPGTDPGLTALRPGLPIQPRPTEGSRGSQLEPVPLEPVKTAKPPTPATPTPSQPTPAPEPKPPGSAPSVPRVEEKEKSEDKVKSELEPAQLAVESALTEASNATKELDRLKAIKNPSPRQKSALAAAKKTKQVADENLAKAQKSLEELVNRLKPAPEPQPPQPAATSPAAPSAPAAAESKPGVAKEPLKDAGKDKPRDKADKSKAGKDPVLDSKPKTEPPAEKAPEKPKTPAAGRNSIGMDFAPVGDVMFSVYETRLKDFMTFVSESGYAKKGWKNPGFEQSLDHPVVRVNWNDANLFCKWLTERERKLGLLAEGEYYRLPTDLEWSRAVGLPEESGASPQERDRQFPQQFPWGTEWPPVAGAGNFNGQETGSDIAIKNYSDPFPWTAPVGSGRANALGLHDLSGNVWEWVMDTYNKDSKARVLRGGAYDSSLKDALISSCRLPAQPERERDQWGFRVVRAKDGGLGAPKVP